MVNCSKDKFRCYCGLPFARLQGDSIVVESRHRGQKHTNFLRLSEIIDYAIQSGDCGTKEIEEVSRIIDSYRLQTYFLHNVVIAK